MSVTCQNPSRPTHEIAEGARKITLSAIVAWGQQDIRGDWAGEYVFCSFGCLSEWAATRAADHDGTVLVDGGDVEQQPPPEPTPLPAPTPLPTPAPVDPAAA